MSGRFFRSTSVRNKYRSCAIKFSVFSARAILQKDKESNGVMFPVQRRRPGMRLCNSLSRQVYPIFRRVRIFYVTMVFPRVPTRPSKAREPREVEAKVLVLPRVSCESKVSPSVRIIITRPSKGSVSLSNYLLSVLYYPTSRIGRQFLTFARITPLDRPMVRLHIRVGHVVATPKDARPIIPSPLRIYALTSQPKKASRRMSNVVRRRLYRAIFPNIIR